MRPSLRGDDRVGAVREEDGAGATPIGECGVARGDQGDPCLDAEVFYAGAVEGGEGEGEGSADGERGGGWLRLGAKEGGNTAWKGGDL